MSSNFTLYNTIPVKHSINIKKIRWNNNILFKFTIIRQNIFIFY